jgi:hypothetical protein
VDSGDSGSSAPVSDATYARVVAELTGEIESRFSSRVEPRSDRFLVRTAW